MDEAVCQNHADHPTLGIRPGNCPGRSGVSERLRRDKVSEEVPDRRPAERPAQPPWSTNLLVLVGNHGAHGGWAEHALGAVTAAAEKCQHEPSQVSHGAVHTTPGVSHIPPVRTVRPEAFGIACVRIRRGPGMNRPGYLKAAESQCTVPHFEWTEDLLLHEIPQTHACEFFHDSGR